MSKLYDKLVLKAKNTLQKNTIATQEDFESNDDLVESQKAWLKDNSRFQINQPIFEHSQDLFPAILPLYESYVIKKNCDEYGIEYSRLLDTNTSILRSDEFISKHIGKHILFAGCSLTFGDGLPKEYTWPYIVYDSISKTEPTSGYFNVGRPGASNLWIILQIFKYINIYGMPDIIFINFPDSDREIADDYTGHRIQVVPAVAYNFLHKMVSDAGSRIISFSWDARANVGYEGYLKLESYDARPWMKDFYQYRVDSQYEYIYNFCEQNKNNKDIFLNKFSLYAMDNAHPGSSYHSFFADLALDAYYKNISPSNPRSTMLESYERKKAFVEKD